MKNKKSVRIDSGVKKGQVALFWKNLVIAGDCRWTGKKYKDGQVIIEITFTTKIKP